MIRDWLDFKGICGGIEGARAKFEQACESTLREIYPSEYVQTVRANPGDEGIDVLVGDIGEKSIKVYQCKFFLEQLEEAQKAQVRDSFETAVRSQKYKLAEWYLCIPKTLDIAEHKWWVSWSTKQTAKYGVPLHLINGNEIIKMMTENKTYNTFFKDKDSTLIEQIHNAVVTDKLPKTNLPIRQFEFDLMNWFKVLNYSFENYSIDELTSFEWIINVRVRRGFDRIYVLGLCEEAELHHVNYIQQRIAEHRCDEGWIVSTRRISQAAIAHSNAKVYCYTFDSLIDENANFDVYLNWLEELIIAKGIDKRYIPLACTKDELERYTRKKLGKSEYNEENGGIEGYIDRWLDDPSKKHISVLGEFGTGKTWFTMHYAWRLIQIYKMAKQKGIMRPRLPLFIPLRDYAKAVSVESLFSEFFFRKHKIPIPGYSAFEQLNKMGKLLLIFDGFDEMADRIDRQKMINNFWELTKVVTDNSKVLLTCRNEHFPEAQEGRALLNAELKASVSNLTGEPPQFEVLELQRFDDKQVKKVLLFYTAEKIVDKIIGNPELLDLARRPVMIELIVEALPDIEAGKPVDMSRIYLYAVTRKMKRDIKEQRTFTSLADKLYFMCEVSWEMLSTSSMSLNYKLFPNRIRNLFGEVVQEQTSLDHWHYDMMGQTMLIRNENGDYTPAHRSLLEFFTAYKIGAELGILTADFLEMAKEQSDINHSLPAQAYTWLSYFTYKAKATSKAPLSRFAVLNSNSFSSNCFGSIRLTKAILDLLLNMITIEEISTQNFLSSIVQSCKGRSFEDVGYTSSNIVTILSKYKHDYFKGKDLSHLCLHELYVEEANRHSGVYLNTKIDFTGTDFRCCDLESSNFVNIILNDANLHNTNLKNASFNISRTVDSILVLPNSSLIASYCWKKLILIDFNKIVVKESVIDLVDASLAVSPDGKIFATRKDNGFRIIDAVSLAVIEDHTDPFPEDNNVYLFSFFKNSRKLLLAGESNSIYVWDLDGRKVVSIIKINTTRVGSESFGVYRMSLSNDEKYVFIRCTEGSKLWDVELGTLIDLSHLTQEVHDVVFHPFLHQYVVLEYLSPFVTVYDSCTHEIIRKIDIDIVPTAYTTINEIHLSRDGSVFSVIREEMIVLYKYEDGSFISKINYKRKSKAGSVQEMKFYDCDLSSVEFDNSGNAIYVSSGGAYVSKFDVKSGKFVDGLCLIEGVKGADFSSAKGIDEIMSNQLISNGAIIN